jgi:hypothetical protein
MVAAATQAALEANELQWRLLLYADIAGDELRATTGIYDKTISGSGDSELDGSYFSINQDLVELSPVTHNESGSNSVTVTLNGILVAVEAIEDTSGSVITQDDGETITIRSTALLQNLGQNARWQGRTARLWFYLVDADEAQIGTEYVAYYTGFMDDVKVSGDARSQQISMTIENYIVSLTGASNKTYQMQSEFDSRDNSAAATLGAANGIAGGVISGAGGGGGGAGTDTDTTRRQLL